MKYYQKLFKHFKLVCKHKWYVFLASVEAGIPIRGFLHDFSKFSPIEFFNSVKYYNDGTINIIESIDYPRAIEGDVGV